LTETRIGNCNSALRHILDCGPKAKVALVGNMLAMNPPRSTKSSGRRFLLLPEDDVRSPAHPAQRPAVRRYRLAGIGRGERKLRLDGTEFATARVAGELGRLHSYG